MNSWDAIKAGEAVLRWGLSPKECLDEAQPGRIQEWPEHPQAILSGAMAYDHSSGIGA